MGLISKLLIGLSLDDKGLRKGVRRSKKSLSGFQKSTKAISGSIVKSLGAIGAGFAIGSVIADAAKTVGNFEQSVADLASISGKSAGQISALVDNAKKVGSTSAFSATEVIALQTELAKLGNTESQIISMTKSVGDFSISVGTTAAEAATFTGGVLNSFGKNANETRSVVNSLAVATTKSALDFTKLNEALPKVGAAAELSGVSLERTTALLGVLADSNIKASKSGNSLKNIFLILKEKGLTYGQAMEEINNSTDKLNTANEIFGRENATVAATLAVSTQKVNELESAIIGADGALDKMTKQRLETAQGKTILLESAWEGLVLSMDSGNGFLAKSYESILEGATGFLSVLTDISKADPAKESKKQRKELDILLKSLVRNTDNITVKNNLILQLNTKYKKYLKNIDLEKLGINGVNTALGEYDKLNNKKIAGLVYDEKRNRLLSKQKELVGELVDAEIRHQKNLENDKAGVIFSGSTLASGAAVKLLRKESEELNKEIQTLAESAKTVRNRWAGAANVMGGAVKESLLEVNKEIEKPTGITGDETPKKIVTFASRISELKTEIEQLSEAYVAGGSTDDGLLGNITQKTTELAGLNTQLAETSRLAGEAFGSGRQVSAPAAIGGTLAGGLGGSTAPPTLSEGFINTDEINAQKDAINAQKDATEGLASTYTTLGNKMGDSLAAGASSFKEFANASKKIAAEIIADQIRVFVASELAKNSLFTSGIGLFFAPVIAGLAAGVFKTAISSLSVPALAEGGVVSGPRIVQVGEYAGASTNPEIIAPEKKLTKIFSSVLARNGGGGGELFGELRGSDILLSNKREQSVRKRTAYT